MGLAFLTDAADFIQGIKTTRVPYSQTPVPTILWTCPYCGWQGRRTVTSITVVRSAQNEPIGTVVGDVICGLGHSVSIGSGTTTRLANVRV